MDLTAAEARRLRMRNLLLDPPPDVPAPSSVGDVVDWFGAMQAQDYASGLWSLGVRLPTLTRTDVVAALEDGQAIRTWPMRGTLHWVPAADAGWMVRLMGPRALARAQRRHEQLGLDPDDLSRAADVLGEALRGRRLTRAECLAALARAGFDTSSQRGYHLLWYAAQVGVACVTPNVGRQQTFALLDDWAPRPRRPDRDEALATMAWWFVRSHGPVAVTDLAGWTGLTMADARTGLHALGPEVVDVRAEGIPMVVSRASLEALDAEPPRVVDAWRVLPGFDEYLLGYKDRSLMLTPEQMQAVIPGRNGVFQATVVRDGRVVGLWKRRETAARAVVTVTPLTAWDEAWVAAASAEFARYGRYLERPVRVDGL